MNVVRALVRTSAGRVIVAILALLDTILLAWVLSSDEFALLMTTLSICLFCSLSGQMGLHQGLLRLQAEQIKKGYDGNRILSLSLFITGIGTAFISTSTMMLIGVLSLQFPLGLLEKVEPVSVILWSIVAGLTSLLGESFRSSQKFFLASIHGGQNPFGPLGTQMSVVAVCGWALVGVDPGVNASMVLSVMCVAGGVQICLSTVAHFVGRSRSEPWKETPNIQSWLRLNAPLFGAHTSMYFLSQLPLWAAAATLGAKDTSILHVAVRLCAMMAFVVSVTNNVLSGKIPSWYFKGEIRLTEGAVRSMATITTTLCLSVMVLFILAGGSIVYLTTGIVAQYANWVLAILALGHVVNAVTGANGLLLALTSYQGIFFAVSVASGILAVGLGLAFGQAFGIFGYALWLSLHTSISNVAGMWIVKRKLGFWSSADMKFVNAYKNLWKIR